MKVLTFALLMTACCWKCGGASGTELDGLSKVSRVFKLINFLGKLMSDDQDQDLHEDLEAAFDARRLELQSAVDNDRDVDYRRLELQSTVDADDKEPKKDAKALAREFLEFVGKTAFDPEAIQKWLDAFENLGSTVGLIADVLSVFNKDEMQDELMGEFAKVHREIASLQNDIESLRDDMHLEFEKAKIDAYLEKVKTAVRISRDGSRDELQRYCSKLFVNGTYDTLSCYEPLGILVEKVPALLDAFYRFTRGDLPKLLDLQSRLFNLILSGELIVQNLNNNLPPQERFDVGKRLADDIGAMRNSCQSIIDKCHRDFGRNMEKDIRDVLLAGGNNEDVLDRLNVTLRPKYDWLHLGIIVYDGISGAQNHYLSGDFVHVFRMTGKNVAVFYSPKSRHAPRPIPESTCRVMGGLGQKSMDAHQLSDLLRQAFPWLSGLAVTQKAVGTEYDFPSEMELCYSKSSGYYNVFALP